MSLVSFKPVVGEEGRDFKRKAYDSVTVSSSSPLTPGVPPMSFPRTLYIDEIMWPIFYGSSAYDD